MASELLHESATQDEQSSLVSRGGMKREGLPDFPPEHQMDLSTKTGFVYKFNGLIESFEKIDPKSDSEPPLTKYII